MVNGGGERGAERGKKRRKIKNAKREKEVE